MAEYKLTDKHLRNLKPSESEQLIGDGGGLWVRVLPMHKGGGINFYYRFQLSGKERRYNCGTYPKTTLAQARENRNLARNFVKKGIDPVQFEENEKASRQAAQALERMEKTVTDLLDDWKRVYLSVHRKDGGLEVEAAMKRDVLPQIGNMKAKDVRLAHVVEIIDKVLERGARRTANVVLSLMRQMFRHGLARGIVEMDPTLALSKKHAGGKEISSNRNLSLEEIAELQVKLPASGLHVKTQAAIWFLLATGARIGEMLKAKWTDIDEANKTWTIPAENAKNGRQHIIHLSDFAMKQFRIFSALRSNPYLLAGRAKNAAMSDKSVSKMIRDRIRAEPLKNRSHKSGTLVLSGGEWSPHDLRRTMASRMGDLGVEPHIIERCLNHIQQGIVGVYQRQEYLNERRKAFELWGRKLNSICDTGAQK